MKVTTKNGTMLVEVSKDDSFKSIGDFKQHVANCLRIDSDAFYLTNTNGKKINEEDGQLGENNGIYVVPRILGGKGGFGSMLRAIGAQIEKTTNRDACRDLSGRRLRDINEEQRLKRWFSKQQEREQEKVEAKKRKLAKLRKVAEGPPLPKIDDQYYNKQRAEMADSVYAAVDKGFEEVKPSSSSAAATATSSNSSDESSNEAVKDLSTSSSSESGPSTSNTAILPKASEPKKRIFKKTMMDEDLDSCTSSDESEDETASKKARVGN